MSEGVMDEESDQPREKEVTGEGKGVRDRQTGMRLLDRNMELILETG